MWRWSKLFDVQLIRKKQYDPLKVEEQVLEYWEKNKIYYLVKKRVWDERKNAPIFAFLEGPPTTNGFMHVGHARGRTFKDVKLRFYRMLGYRVWDQAGWDTQGLPVEIEVEKKLGFKSKKDIESFGVEKFVEECSKLVDYYLEAWEKASKRLGLWLDYEHAYQTRHPRYVETVWMFIKRVWEKGLLYEDLRVVPRCPRCGTALSQHEVAQGYKEVDDPSLYFKLPLEGREGEFLVAWTTTPWTIIANEAAVVHPDETYVVLDVGGEKWILAERRLKPFVEEVGLEKYEVVRKVKGRDLVGLRYRHPLLEEVPYHRNHKPPYHTVLAAEWVTMEEGTGIVHAAPAHGPEDFELGKQHGIVAYTPLRENGVFGEDAGVFAGLWFEKAAEKVVEVLKRKGLVIHVGTYRHTYPFCWRCDTRLFYYASRQWFIKLPEELKRKMVEEVESMKWSPSWALNRMKNWVENAKDWCISRERYWGTPLPVWRCGKCGHIEVVGSIEELKSKAVNPEELKDVHRPWIDKIRLRCPKCGNEMAREPFVVDVWMDSGVAHTAALRQYGWDHLLEKLYPYTWITEAADQTRGWFYTLLVTGVILYGVKPYQAVLLQGHVLDKYGRKMSKSRGNVIWAYDFMSQHGADPMRLFLLSRAPWDSINFDPDEVVRYRSVINTLWNVVRFAISYMELDKWKPQGIETVKLDAEDVWVLAKLYELADNVAAAIESDNMHQAVRLLEEFIVEILSHRYVTVVRPRVWVEEETESKKAVYETLFHVIDNLLKIMAPFTPFVTEYLYHTFVLNFRKGFETIHLETWPKKPANLVLDEMLVKVVDRLFEAAEKILALRMEAGIKRRWPLREAIIVPKDFDIAIVRKAAHILARYANIKSVRVEEKPPTSKDYTVVEVEGFKVYVTLKLDEETLLEGLAREVIRRAQVMRKEADLPLDAYISKLIVCTSDDMLRKAVEKHRQFIAGEVRAKEVELVDVCPENGKEWKIESRKVVLKLEL